MSALRGIKRGVQKRTQERATENMPGMEQGSQEMPMEGQDGSLKENMDGGQKLTPEQERFTKGMHSMILNYMYRDETKGPIGEILRSGPMERVIPMTAQSVFDQFEILNRNNGKPLDLEGKALAMLFIFQETLDMATAMGVAPEDMPEEMLEKLMVATMQDKIHQGLKDGSIDPVELQAKIEPYLDEELQDAGMRFADSTGTSRELNDSILAERSRINATRPLKAENERLKSELQTTRTAAQGMAQAVPEGEEGGQQGPPPQGMGA